MWKSVRTGFGVAATNAAIRAGDARLLSRGTAALESVLARTSPQHRRFPFLAAALSTALRERYQQQHAPADLERALELIRQAAAATTSGHRQYGWIQTSLARTLTRHAMDTRSAAELDDAVEAGLRGVEALTAASRDQAERHTVLGIALKTRYDLTGSEEDLAESITHIRAAQNGQPRHQTDKDTIAANSAFSYVESFRRYGRPDDLEAVIENLDPAARSPSEVAKSMSRALAARSRALGEASDLDESITLGELAADLAPTGKSRWDAMLWLGQALTIRYEDRGNPADIDRAVEHLRSALAHIDERDFGRAAYLESLGHALWARYEGGAGLPEDVEASVRVLQDAVARTPSRDAGAPGRSANLAAALWTWYGITQDPRDLDAAIDHGEVALKSSAPGHADRTRLLLNLGIGHKSRFDARGEPRDAQRAIALWQEAAQFTDIRVGMRIGAARNWGELATHMGDTQSALAGYEAAINMLPQIAWRGLSTTGQQRILGSWSGLATDSASAALNAGESGRAVELVETGRGISWEHALALRSSLGALQRVSPQLADRITSIRGATVAAQD